MSKRKRSITLLPHERQVLTDLYLHFKIPIDQYEGRPEELATFTEEFHEMTGRVDSSADLIRYMRNRRKNSDWPTLDGKHLPSPILPPLTADETVSLIAIYKCNVTDVHANCTDVLAHAPELTALIVKEFAKAAGRVVPAHVLVPKLTALRKRGMLDKIEQIKPEEGEFGFEDMDQAAE